MGERAKFLQGGQGDRLSDDASSAEDGEEDPWDLSSRVRRHCRGALLCRALCCSCCCVLGLPVAIVVLWLIAGIIAGSPGDPEYKHAFEAMAPLRSIGLAELEEEMPLIVGTAPLPKQLRGVFWLTDQGRSSALCSFGGPNDDRVAGGGKECSSGEIGSDGKLCVRVSGDRVWSLRSSVAAFVYAVNDIRYIFTFDSDTDPRYATIQNFCDLRGLAPGYDLFFFSSLLDMTLLDSHPVYHGSVVWERLSVLPGRNETYELVQVVDETGERIEPAWGAFMDYQRRVVGDGDIYFRAYRE